jgi:light-regulated signal transduction histidine kinase (bacteriophytochrome)
MKLLINDLLNYSRVGNNNSKFSNVDTHEAMQHVIRLLKKESEDKKAIIILKVMPVIKADKTLIGDLFLNLVGNALKYCGNKIPEIEIGSEETAVEFTFYVKDNGIGIGEEDFEKIFVIFKRLHSFTEQAGTGIGLALCKKIMEIHHGKIWVESVLGEGSTFYFTIPKLAAEERVNL